MITANVALTLEQVTTVISALSDETNVRPALRRNVLQLESLFEMVERLLIAEGAAR